MDVYVIIHGTKIEPVKLRIKARSLNHATNKAYKHAITMLGIYPETIAAYTLAAISEVSDQSEFQPVTIR